MNAIMERFKHIPMPVWIGLALVILVLLYMSSKSSAKKAAASAPPTDATVGTQGKQPSAGAEQEVGSLTSITQSGFQSIIDQENQQSALLASLAQYMGNSRGMAQFGGSIANAQPQPVNNAGNQTAASQPSTSQVMVHNAHSNDSPQDIGTHMGLDSSGNVITIRSSYGGATDQEKDQMNAFAHRYPNGYTAP